jgi:ribonuclease HII
MLQPFYTTDKVEAGIDEVGRGTLFGRVYVAAVILPRDGFDYSILKDSKKFTNKKKLREVYEYIKQHAIYTVKYAEHDRIDKINILNTTMELMHDAATDLLDKGVNHILVDGNRFNPVLNNNKIVPYTCIEGGDNMYCAIAAASIIAKVERDDYVDKMCEVYPYLDECYGLVRNKGYGTKIHIEGIKKYGISQWHRKTFGICKSSTLYTF